MGAWILRACASDCVGTGHSTGVGPPGRGGEAASGGELKVLPYARKLEPDVPIAQDYDAVPGQRITQGTDQVPSESGVNV